jgi:hypothetical protein
LSPQPPIYRNQIEYKTHRLNPNEMLY